MATYLTERQVRAKISGIDTQTARVFIAAHNAISGLRDSFDIFLSHSIKDAGLILGVRRILEEAGKSVYIDWIDDPISSETVSAAKQQKNYACA